MSGIFFLLSAFEGSKYWFQNWFHSRTAGPLGDEDGAQSGVSFFQVIVNDHELIPVQMRNVFHCLAEPVLNSTLVLSIPGAEAPFQFGETRRSDEDVNSFVTPLLQLSRTLDFDVEQQIVAGKFGRLNLAPVGAVGIPRKPGVFKESACVNIGLELFGGNEMIIDAFNFAGPRGPRGAADREPDSRQVFQDAADKHGLPGTGGA
jgi:hypothetical protein